MPTCSRPAPAAAVTATTFTALVATLLALLLGARPASAAPQFDEPDFSFGGGGGAQFFDSRDEVSVEIVPLRESVAPDGDLAIAVVLRMNPTWHVWTHADLRIEGAARFESAIHTAVTITAPEGAPIAVLSNLTQWPEAHLVTADVGEGPKEYAVFEEDAPIFIPLRVPPDAAPGTYEFTVSVDFQACDDTNCLAPANVTETVTFTVAANAAASGDAPAVFAGMDTTVFGQIRAGETGPEIVRFDVFGWEFEIDASGAGFVVLLAVAFFGGLLLNFTPCVLPVIPLKIMGLSAAAGTTARRVWLGAVMSLGVVFFWLVLGTAIASIKGFEATNQLFQYPAFTISIGLIIVVMAIGMAGFFSIKLPQKVYLIEASHDSSAGSFLFGIMTAILSTPCTAPLMGAAAAWATTQSPATVLAVFAAIGAGMAVPYLLLTFFPKLLAKLPRTGPASDLIKQTMGLLLLAAGLYFLGSGIAGILVTPPDPPNRFFWWLVAGTACLAGVWLVIRTVKITRKPVNRVVFAGLGVFILALSAFVGWANIRKSPINWIYYTPDRFAEARAANDVVVLEFTAEWCANCKALEAGVLHTRAVYSELNGDGVRPIKVDLTGNNEDGNAKLKDVGRITIPLLVVFDRNGNEVFKSDSYTQGQVLEALETARGAG